MWALNVILSLLLLHYYSNVVAKHFLIETKGQDLGSDYAASVKDVKGAKKDDECKPGVTWKSDCNTCHCDENGKLGGCTKMLCVDENKKDLGLVEDDEIAEADDAFTFSEFGEPLTTSDPMGFLYRDHVFG